LFDRAHGSELGGAAGMAEDVAFENADTVLGRDGAAIAARALVSGLEALGLGA